MITKYQGLVVIVLVVLVSIFLFFNRLYHNDIKKLTDFVASYEKFDKAILDFSISKTDDLETKADYALAELNTKSVFRLSSLIRNEKKLMDQALVVADLSRKELVSLKAYKKSAQNKSSDLDRLTKEYSNLSNQRKDAYIYFWSFGPAEK